ncbi:MAG: hypothetical protein D6681_08945 [Calditrichaeota bacterium]|nr:MAG: hypothetical protein D6681_08945 [Calditrichota bacterium]
MKAKVILVVVWFVVLGSLSVQGQEFGNQVPIPFGDRPAQYILGSGDVLLISVNLWGHVRKPGIYNIPSNFGIIDLLSSAGGPLSSARLNDVRIIRKNQEVITVNIEEFIKTGNKDLLVPLQPGDVIIVSGSISDIFGRVVGFIRDVAIIVNVILLATRI